MKKFRERRKRRGKPRESSREFAVKDKAGYGILKIEQQNETNQRNPEIPEMEK